MTPLVSVVLPTHNRARLFERALASILAQTFADFEVLVIENACSDETASILSAKTDARIRRLVLPTLKGASAARNMAIQSARGSLIAFQDDDDIWLPDKLEKQIAVLEAQGESAGLCLCGYIRLGMANVKCFSAPHYFEGMSFDRGPASADFTVIATPGWLARKSFIDAVGGFDESLPARNDWELGLRLSQVCRIVYVAEPLFIQDQTRQTTMMRNAAAYAAALQHIESKHGWRWRDEPAVTARHARIIGTQELLSGRVPSARSWLRKSLASVWFQPYVWSLYLLSALGGKFVAMASGLKRRFVR